MTTNNSEGKPRETFVLISEAYKDSDLSGPEWQNLPNTAIGAKPNYPTTTELVKSDMDRGVEAMRLILDKKMFVHRPSGPIPTVTWKDRLRWKARRVRWYFSTLWLALKGADLREDSDDYD